ncbi:MAG: T9SS type A sorting domain-containing protein [Saprospiraceae bacterium]
MKRINLLILLLSPIVVWSQNNGSFLQSSSPLPIVSPHNMWVADHEQFVPFMPDQIWRFTFSEDSTLLDSQYYRELIYSSSISGNNWSPTGRFYREEAGRVFFTFPNASEEMLLYDFNFEVGDTMVPNTGIGQASRVIIAVDTIELMDITPRKRLALYSPECMDTVYWIEGAGELRYLFETELFCSLPDGPRDRVRCFSTDGQLLHLRSGLLGCFLSSSKEEDLDISLDIYPNPMTDLVHIYLNGADQIQLKAINVLGQALFSGVLQEGKQEIHCEDWPAGTYFFQFTDSNNRIASRQILKQ